MQRIYAHGLGQTPASWRKIIEGSKSVECSACPDLAEMCRDKEVTYENLYKGFSKFCDSFDEKLDLCGLSLGGVLSLDYAIEHIEKVNSLVLIATQYKMPKNLLKFQNILFRAMPRSMFQQTGFGKKEFIQLCDTMRRLDLSHSIQKVVCPTLVVCGERDHANKKASMELVSFLKDAELQMISGAGHEVNIEAPERLTEILCDLYDRVQ